MKYPKIEGAQHLRENIYLIKNILKSENPFEEIMPIFVDISRKGYKVVWVDNSRNKSILLSIEKIK